MFFFVDLVNNVSIRGKGLPWWLTGKESACQCRRHRFSPWVRKMPWKRKWQPSAAFLPGKSHGQRGLADYGPRGHKRVSHNLATKQHQRREQDGRGAGGGGVHLSPWIPQEYTFRHRSACRIPAESGQEYLTSGKEYIKHAKKKKIYIYIYIYAHI